MKLYNVEQISVILSCHPNTTRKLLNSGKLQGFKDGSNWKIEKNDLNNYIKNLKSGVINNTK